MNITNVFFDHWVVGSIWHGKIPLDWHRLQMFYKCLQNYARVLAPIIWPTRPTVCKKNSQDKRYKKTICDVSTLLYRRALKSLEYFCQTTHVCVQDNGCSLSYQYVIQFCSRQTPDETNTALCQASMSLYRFRENIRLSSAVSVKSACLYIVLESRNAHVW